MNQIILDTIRPVIHKEQITNDDILTITSLDLSRKNLTDVSDLSQFENLENLILTENCLSDLSPISNLVKLKELRAGNDPFLSEEEKAARKGKNHFTDYSFLYNLKNLTHVCFTDTDIDNIEFVEMLPKLKEFWAYCNPIKDISPLKKCKNLYKAYFFNCPISDINVCRKLPSLCGLAINATGVSDLTPLENNNDFVYLDAHNAEICDITPIKGMRKMDYLTLEGNHISDLTPLLGMQSLRWLTIGDNKNLNFKSIISIVPQLKGLIQLSVQGFDFTNEQKQIFKEEMPNVAIIFEWD